VVRNFKSRVDQFSTCPILLYQHSVKLQILETFMDTVFEKSQLEDSVSYYEMIIFYFIFIQSGAG